MKTIEIDDDLYDYLLRNSVRIGEGATEILRRLLGVTDAKKAPSELSEYLDSSSFRIKRKAIDKFLGILSHVYERNPEDFKKVLAITGRNRKYYALSNQELEDSGRSVFPKKIPGSRYWVVTNNDTQKKQRMLEDVLRVLGYSRSSIEEAVNSLA